MRSVDRLIREILSHCSSTLTLQTREMLLQFIRSTDLETDLVAIESNLEVAKA